MASRHRRYRTRLWSISIIALIAVGVLLTLRSLNSVAAPAPPDDLLTRENDEHLITVADRTAALTELIADAESARDRGELVRSARLLNRAARLQFRLIQLPAAAGTYDQALTLIAESPDGNTEVDSLTGKASVLVYQGNCTAADPLLNRALLLSQQHAYPAGQVSALIVRSECEGKKDRGQALITALESLRIAEAANDRPSIAQAHQTIGELQLGLTKLTEATAHLNQALQIWQELDLTVEQAEAIIYLGFVAYRKGATQETISLLSDAQSRIDQEAEPYKMGQITGTMAEALLDVGMPDDAVPLFQNAANYFQRAERKSALAVLAWDVGRTYYFQGKFGQAIIQLESTLIESRIIEDEVLTARCHDFLGRSYLALGNSAQALTHYRAALDIFAQSHLDLEVARTGALIGQVYESENETARAKEQYLTALRTFDRLTDRINQSVTLFALGKLSFKENDMDAAEDYLRQSIAVTENLRRNSTAYDLTAAISATVYDRYEKYVECLMRQHAAHPGRGFGVRAFETSELGRGRSLANLLQGTDISLVPDLDPALRAKERELRQLLRVNADQQVELLAETNYQKAEFDELKIQQTQLEAEYKQVTDSVRQRYPAFGEIVQPAAWTLQQIQEQVISDDQTVLLEYSLGDDKSYAWAVTRDGFKSYELPGRAAIDAAAQAVYKKMSAAPAAGNTSGGNNGELIAAQQELGRLVLAPVAAELNKSRVIAVADGVLNYIPFQSLPDPADNANPLVARLEVINAPSASILGALGKESATRPRPTKLLAAFGNPVFESNYAEVINSGATPVLVAENSGNGDDRWRHALRDIEIAADSPNTKNIQPLIYSGLELSNLRSVGGGDSLIASEFNASRENVLRTDLSQYSILHFATHGFLDPKRPEKSGLVLSLLDNQHKSIDGYLGLQDIYSLRAPVDLVVLSACRTGLGKDVKGEGLIGLTRGFMYAGASTVVASLWKVDDKATAALMKEFYANLLEKSMTPAAALRAAQNTIRSKPEWSSPYYWAAFTIQGDYRAPIRPVAPPLAPGLGKRLMIAFAVLGLLAILAWRLRKDKRDQRDQILVS